MPGSVLTVLSLDADGFAHTDHSNRLRLALPGERLRAFAAGDFFLPKEIIAAHPQRLAAPCPHYGRCGGCDLQHAAYALQLALKGQSLHDLLAASRESAVRAVA
ncbi:MAG TPA: RNA methyltransferase, partial [Desulfobulbaceae bacterium]|nr:RNA methyltransferase [Desulfobulbaceae bacterium]